MPGGEGPLHAQKLRERVQLGPDIPVRLSRPISRPSFTTPTKCLYLPAFRCVHLLELGGEAGRWMRGEVKCASVTVLCTQSGEGRVEKQKRCFSRRPGRCQTALFEPDATAGHAWGRSALVHLQHCSAEVALVCWIPASTQHLWPCALQRPTTVVSKGSAFLKANGHAGLFIPRRLQQHCHLLNCVFKALS